jgi:CheY-like chemotaxis protein
VFCFDQTLRLLPDILKSAICSVSHVKVDKMSDGDKAQILLVDDEPDVRESLGMLLESAGYDVAMAANGVSAVSLVDRVVPDLIVTDLNMPEMSGIELISHVRSRYPAVLIVAMSGDYQEEAVPAGIIADGVLPEGTGSSTIADGNR